MVGAEEEERVVPKEDDEDVMDGEGMLINWGAVSEELWSGEQAGIDPGRRCLRFGQCGPGS